MGTLGGVFWTTQGWPGVAGLVAALLLAAITIALWLITIPARTAQRTR